MELVLRQARQQDAADIYRVYRLAFAQYQGHAIPDPMMLRATPESLRQELLQRTAAVSTVDGEITGCVFMQAEDPDCHIDRLAVLPEWRGQGQARALVAFAEDWGRRHLLQYAVLDLPDSLPAAGRYFRGLGYAAADARLQADRTRMVKPLETGQMGEDGLEISDMDALSVANERMVLASLLTDGVNNGGALGFRAPISEPDAQSYWSRVAQQLADDRLRLLVARRQGVIVGAVQLARSDEEDAGHRGQVSKLMVHGRYRRQGIGRNLLQAVERRAERMGMELLTLDMRRGDPSEKLCQAAGYRAAGVIPGYLRDPLGEDHASAFLYKQLAS